MCTDGRQTIPYIYYSAREEMHSEWRYYIRRWCTVINPQSISHVQPRPVFNACSRYQENVLQQLRIYFRFPRDHGFKFRPLLAASISLQTRVVRAHFSKSFTGRGKCPKRSFEKWRKDVREGHIRRRGEELSGCPAAVDVTQLWLWSQCRCTGLSEEIRTLEAFNELRMTAYSSYR